KPIQTKLGSLELTEKTRPSLIKNLVAIRYQEAPLSKSDFYVKKALLLEGIKGKEEYSYASINNLIATFEKGGARGTSENQRRLIQFYLYQNGFYPAAYITNKKVSLFDACDGVIGTNTRLAIANFRASDTVSAGVVLKLEGEMTRDSIRVVQPAIPAPVAPLQLPKADLESKNINPVAKDTIVSVDPNLTAYQKQLNVLKGQFSKVLSILTSKVKSRYANWYQDLLTKKADAFLQYLSTNKLLDIKDQFTKESLAKNTAYKGFLNMIENISGLPKNGLYGLMMTECKGTTESNGQYIGPFHQGENFGSSEYRSDPIRSAVFAAASLNGGYFDKLKTGSHDIYSFAHAARNYNGHAVNKRSYPGKVLYYMGCMDDTPNRDEVRFLANQYLQKRINYEDWIATNGGDAGFVGFGRPRRPHEIDKPLGSTSLYIGDSLTSGYGSQPNDVRAYPGQESYNILTQAATKLPGSIHPNLTVMVGMNDALRLATEKADDSRVDSWLNDYIFNVQNYITGPAGPRNVFLCTVPVHTKGTLVSKELASIIQKLNARIRQLCSTNPSIKLIDTYNYVRGLAAGGEVKYQSDGIHLATGTDYAKMKAYVDFCIGKTKQSGKEQLIASR
ncbi:MAG: SGNH/GDSL hydrolase family protein, partial [Candidatus Absconditabacterales bacterium]